jgi:hypothetical protein
LFGRTELSRIAGLAPAISFVGLAGGIVVGAKTGRAVAGNTSGGTSANTGFQKPALQPAISQ